MAELGDAYGLGPYGEIRGGSTPLPPTRTAKTQNAVLADTLAKTQKGSGLTFFCVLAVLRG